MVEIMAAREAYNRYEISNVCLFLGDYSLADGLSESKICAQLKELQHRRTGTTKVSQ